LPLYLHTPARSHYQPSSHTDSPTNQIAINHSLFFFLYRWMLQLFLLRFCQLISTEILPRPHASLSTRKTRAITYTHILFHTHTDSTSSSDCGVAVCEARALELGLPFSTQSHSNGQTARTCKHTHTHAHTHTPSRTKCAHTV
jgi:hypothetical protein